MQTDMHYYATYALARAAGIAPERARVIATADEFVDDSNTVSQRLTDGGFIHHDATAHHPAELVPNTDPLDQRKVWVPFHFLPGGQGASLEERLICRQDSPIAQEMLQHALSQAQAPYSAALLGITSHVYADTFSHYGFSGITSVRNKVKEESITYAIKDPSIAQYVKDKLTAFFTGLTTHPANLLALGHGSVATCPDRPYLVWQFTYVDGTPSGERNNPATYLLACEKLFNAFVTFAKSVGDIPRNDARVFAAIRAAVSAILMKEGKLQDRIDAWLHALGSGQLLGSGVSENIPVYDEALFEQTTAVLQKQTTAQVIQTEAYRFMQAAWVHRDYVLGDLLPRHDLLVMQPV